MTDHNTAAIGFSLLLSIFFLAIYLYRKQKKKEQVAAKYLQQLVEHHNLQVDLKEEQAHLLLALDKQAKKLLYVRQPAENPQTTLIDLGEVRTSRMVDTVQTFYMDDEKKRKDTLTTQITLELFYFKNEEAVSITFYDYMEHSTNILPELRAIANNWNKQVQDVIGNPKTKDAQGVSPGSIK